MITLCHFFLIACSINRVWCLCLFIFQILHAFLRGYILVRKFTGLFRRYVQNSIQPKMIEPLFCSYVSDCINKINTRNITFIFRKHIGHRNKNRDTSITVIRYCFVWQSNTFSHAFLVHAYLFFYSELCFENALSTFTQLASWQLKGASDPFIMKAKPYMSGQFHKGWGQTSFPLLPSHAPHLDLRHLKTYPVMPCLEERST